MEEYGNNEPTENGKESNETEEAKEIESQMQEVNLDETEENGKGIVNEREKIILEMDEIREVTPLTDHVGMTENEGFEVSTERWSPIPIEMVDALMDGLEQGLEKAQVHNMDIGLDDKELKMKKKGDKKNILETEREILMELSEENDESECERKGDNYWASHLTDDGTLKLKKNKSESTCREIGSKSPKNKKIKTK